LAAELKVPAVNTLADISMTSIRKIPARGRPTDHDLAADVARAVAEAIETGTTTRADIVRRFEGRASRAGLYNLVADEIEKRGVAALAPPKPGTPLKVAPTIQNEVGDLEERAREIVERAEQQPTDKPVDLVAELHGSIAHCDMLMGLAMDSEGKIRNARLAAVSIDLKGRACERLARVRASQDDDSQAAVYLRQLTDAILAEPPDVRARLLARLRGVSASWGL
jgi:hypothetical protein